jgi:hypothetical protein
LRFGADGVSKKSWTTMSGLSKNSAANPLKTGFVQYGFYRPEKSGTGIALLTKDTAERVYGTSFGLSRLSQIRLPWIWRACTPVKYI